jgi:hypothetical protein
MFVNCDVRGWVTEKTLRTLIAAGAGSGGFAHLVKIDVQLVSFPLSGVRK